MTGGIGHAEEKKGEIDLDNIELSERDIDYLTLLIEKDNELKKVIEEKDKVIDDKEKKLEECTKEKEKSQDDDDIYEEFV